MIYTDGVLPRGTERSTLLEIDLISINMDAADSDEGNDISVAGVSVGGSSDGNITHQFSAKLSFDEADL